MDWVHITLTASVVALGGMFLLGLLISWYSADQRRHVENASSIP